MTERTFRSATLEKLFRESMKAFDAGAINASLMEDIVRVCVLPETVREIKSVTVYETSDGSRHDTIDIARAHQDYVIGEKKRKSDAHDRMMKRWPDTPTLEESYFHGRKCGLEWNDELEYIPCGPYAGGAGCGARNDVAVALLEQQKINRDAWLVGWEYGMLEKYRGEALPEWFAEYRLRRMKYQDSK